MKKENEYSKNFIELNIEIPNQNVEINNIEKLIDRIEADIKYCKFSFNNFQSDYYKYYNRIVDYLEYVGQLSLVIFNIEDIIEEKYFNHYRKENPEYVKKLWYAHYSELHKPYSRLKENCYRLIKTLDKRYKKQFGTLPLFND